MVFRASTASFTSLQSYVEPELLRGVPLHICLSGWAKHWKQNEDAAFSIAAANYDLGCQIEEYDVFLSHDWATSRWLKLFSLMIIFNSRAAFVGSFTASVALGLLRSFEIVPNDMWTIGIGPLMVFVDKLCIAQHDEQLKEKGILALAGFLDHSRKLTVLWSTRYFQRLWCAYELAAFSRAEEKPLQVMPVKMSLILGLMSVGCHIVCLLFYGFAWSDLSITAFSRRLVASGVMMVALCTVMPVVCYIGIQLMDDLTQLPEQLKTFRIQEAKCFCCSSNHVHPLTGRKLICDRKLVFHTLKKWFGHRRDNYEGSHLDLFNQMIQEELSQTILQTVGSDTCPLSYCIYMVSAGNLPFMAQYIPRVADELRMDTSPLNHCVVAARQFMAWAIMSLLSLCAVRISMLFWRVGLHWSKTSWLKSRGLISVLISLLIVLTLSLLWFPFQVVYALTSRYSSIPAVPFGLVILVLFYLFLPREIQHSRQHSLRQKLSDRYRSRRSLSRRASSEGTFCSDQDIFSNGTRMSRESKDLFSNTSRGPSKEPFHSDGPSPASGPTRGSKEVTKEMYDMYVSKSFSSIGSIESITATREGEGLPEAPHLPSLPHSLGEVHKGWLQETKTWDT
ncbi:unnamed protein product [Durusdinium trenchii]|uniref:Uncharacterized protein n=2 Tax=Durusdinium trenchii TaxID=1381693 RepID=A0ABP0JAV8_9DINO